MNCFLDSFVSYGSKLYQLKLLRQHYNSIRLDACVTNQVFLQFLNQYLNFINKSLLDVPADYSLLEYYHVLQDLLSEVDFVHRIFFWKNSFSSLHSSAFQLASDSENLNFLYKLSNSIYQTEPTSEIIRSLWQETLTIVSRMVSSVLFVDPRVDQITSSLKIAFRKDTQGNFVFIDTPHIMMRTMEPLFVSAQSLALIKNYDPQIFEILVSWTVLIPITWDIDALVTSLRTAKRGFKKAERLLDEFFMNGELDKKKADLQKMQKRLQTLRDMKDKIEHERQEKTRLKQIENFKRAQLQHFLEEQIAEKKLKNHYERQLQLEMEKDLIYQRTLKEQEAEKAKLLKEIEGLGRGLDDEIERAIVKEAIEKITSKSNAEASQQQAGDSQQASEEASQVAVSESQVALELKPQSADGKDSNRASTHLPATREPTVKNFNSTDPAESELQGHLPSSEQLFDSNRQSATAAPFFSQPTAQDAPAEFSRPAPLADLRKKVSSSEVQAEASPATQIQNELEQKAFETPAKVEASSDEEAIHEQQSKTNKKLRQVNEEDFNVDLKAMQVLSFHNLVNISKLQPSPEADQQAEEL